MITNIKNSWSQDSTPNESLVAHALFVLGRARDHLLLRQHCCPSSISSFAPRISHLITGFSISSPESDRGRTQLGCTDFISYLVRRTPDLAERLGSLRYLLFTIRVHPINRWLKLPVLRDTVVNLIPVSFMHALFVFVHVDTHSPYTLIYLNRRYLR